MLKELLVENYLLINHLDIVFSNNLNIITGETGAGKSILLGAISLIMGGKADVSILKNKEKKAVLQATFSTDSMTSSLKSLFEKEDIEFESELIIRRVISQNGKSKYYVNEEPVTIAFLKSIGGLLIDIHSQHQTLLLGSVDFQIGVLDSVAENGNNLKDYTRAFSQVKELESNLGKLRVQAQQSLTQQEYLTFQYKQLAEANLSASEFEEMETKYKILANSQLISEKMYQVVGDISQNDGSLLQKLSDVKLSISSVVSYVDDASDYINRLESVAIELKELDRECQSVLDSISSDPTLLDYISNRLDSINSLQMKHSVSSVEELIELREDYKSKLDLIDNFDFHILQAEKKLKKSKSAAILIAEKLSLRRTKSKKQLENFIVKILVDLGMPNSKLEVSMEKSDKLTIYGIDEVEFLFSANKGVACESISKVASGGEMSRLMLSLKALLSSTQNMPTLIFDEIDTGVSGRVADRMGEIINDMARYRQVINITHLPQIAAKGDTHLFVYKEHLENQSVTNIKILSQDERIEEIASMLSGEKMTQSAIDQARELLGL